MSNLILPNDNYVKKPLVSILVPIYNVEKYIESCLDSLFNQRYISVNDIEFIFVDDCGSDSSMRILERYITRYEFKGFNIKVISNNSNQGLAECRNIALRIAKGYYIMHVDSDDYIESNAIYELLQASNNCTADIVLSDVYFDYENRISVCHNNVPNDKIAYISLMLKRKLMFNIWGKLIRRSLYTTNNISTVPGINQGEDYSVYPRLVFVARNVVKIDKPLYHYVQTNPNSYCKLINRTSIDQILYAQKINTDFFKDKIKNQILCESKLATKMSLLIGGSKQDYAYINKQYIDIPILKTKMPIKYKIILILMLCKCYSIVYFILKKMYAHNVK